MFTKIILTTMVGTGLIGGSAAAGFVPTKVELAAGPVRIEAGDGQLFGARFDDHSPLSLTIALANERRLQIKF